MFRFRVAGFNNANPPTALSPLTSCPVRAQALCLWQLPARHADSASSCLTPHAHKILSRAGASRRTNSSCRSPRWHSTPCGASARRPSRPARGSERGGRSGFACGRSSSTSCTSPRSSAATAEYGVSASDATATWPRRSSRYPDGSQPDAPRTPTPPQIRARSRLRAVRVRTQTCGFRPEPASQHVETPISRPVKGLRGAMARSRCPHSEAKAGTIGVSHIYAQTFTDSGYELIHKPRFRGVCGSGHEKGVYGLPHTINRSAAQSLFSGISRSCRAG